jgi:hypothetical protein
MNHGPGSLMYLLIQDGFTYEQAYAEIWRIFL